MQKLGLEILNDIEKYGYEAYIVGGFVRDHYIKKDSYDIDICTNARPKDLIKIFDYANLPKEKYGSVTLFYKNIRFEITTFRKEIKYENRKPIEIEYTDSFIEDIMRRDFTINTLCMNSKGEIIDLLDGKKDIDKKIIKVVGNTNDKFSDDPLRMLRAIRFATQLNFKLDKETIIGIKNNMYLLESLSFQRKRDELNKIFVSTNVKYGLKLLRDLGAYKHLCLNNINNIKITTDVIGMWAQFDVVDIYPFTHLERENIISINQILKDRVISKNELYKYGLYSCSIAAQILGVSKNAVFKMNKALCIHSIKDIEITTEEICELLKKEPGKWLKEVYNNIETKIIELKLENDNKKIKQYIIKNY